MVDRVEKKVELGGQIINEAVVARQTEDWQPESDNFNAVLNNNKTSNIKRSIHNAPGKGGLVEGGVNDVTTDARGEKQVVITKLRT